MWVAMSAAHGHIQIHKNVPQTRVDHDKNPKIKKNRHCDLQDIKTISLIDSFVIRQLCCHRKALNLCLFSKVRVNHPDPFDAVEGSVPRKEESWCWIKLMFYRQRQGKRTHLYFEN